MKTKKTIYKSLDEKLEGVDTWHDQVMAVLLPRMIKLKPKSEHALREASIDVVLNMQYTMLVMLEDGKMDALIKETLKKYK